MGERADDTEADSEPRGDHERDTQTPKPGEKNSHRLITDGGAATGPSGAGSGTNPPERSDSSEINHRENELHGVPDVAALEARVDRLQTELETIETDLDERTVKRPQLEAELKRYVRGRLRRGHARGWGPYLVLLYGVVLTLGAFRFLDGPWAIAAMGVLFLSTLGLYALFILVGIGLNALSAPGKALDIVRDRKE